MPAYLDFLSAFGSRTEASDLRFTGFREQTSLAKPPHAMVIRDLGRSGRQLQLSYNLKTVGRNLSPARNLLGQEWIFSQAAFHHQFDVEEGTSLWIITHRSASLRERMMEMISIDGRLADQAISTTDGYLRSSLSTHLLYCQWTIEEWREYVKWLEKEVNKEVSNL